MSLLAVIALSLLTWTPTGRDFRWVGMLVFAIFLGGWLFLAFWARRKLRTSNGTAAVPAWIVTLVAILGFLYSISVVFGLIA